MPKSINDLAVEYGKQVENRLKALGAQPGQGLGAGALLDQLIAQDALDDPTLKVVRRFLRLRNEVIHGDGGVPAVELERAAAQALQTLDQIIASRYQQSSFPAQNPPRNLEEAKKATSIVSAMIALEVLAVVLFFQFARNVVPPELSDTLIEIFFWSLGAKALTYYNFRKWGMAAVVVFGLFDLGAIISCIILSTNLEQPQDIANLQLFLNINTLLLVGVLATTILRARAQLTSLRYR